MIWFIVPSIALLMIVCAFALEFVFRNESKKPFSRHSLNRRRWDDPNYQDKALVLVPGSLVGSGLTLGHESRYLVSKDPGVQSKILAG